MAKTFTFNRTGADGISRPEPVADERWRWRAIYQSGLVFNQFDDDTLTFHQFAEIDQSQVQIWQLVNGSRKVTFLLKPGDKLIHFYRNIGFDYMGENHHKVRLYCLGFIRDGQKTVAIITPDDEIVITDEADNLTVS